jgi:hypothetical protein
MILYFQYEKARLERKRIVEMSKGYGKPKVGGPFKLRDLNGKEFTEKDLLGKYSLVGTPCAVLLARNIHQLLTTPSDIFRLLTLSRHLPRRTRQDVRGYRHSPETST